MPIYAKGIMPSRRAICGLALVLILFGRVAYAQGPVKVESNKMRDDEIGLGNE
jgi:hypothetical protein